ncbi:MAG: ATP-binding protein [Eubacteriales bacterium]|nr:ATP-binding protein [Eubacteriales bacterium]
MLILIDLLRYSMIAIFGVVLSVYFTGADNQKGSTKKIALFSAFVTVFQLLFQTAFGFEFTKWMYPLIAHIPLVIFLVVAFNRSWSISVAGVLLAYSCCQIPRWIAATSHLFSDEILYNGIFHIIAIIVVFLVLRLYVANAVYKALSRSWQASLTISVLPLLYYIFDYATTVYTDLLYTGNPFVVQFMPSLMCTGYLFFLLVYQSGLELQEKAKHDRDILSIQLRHSETEYASLCQLQEKTREYHHDLRHHVRLLMGFAEEENIQEIKGYLKQLGNDLNSYSPKRYCSHNVVNLLLSHFEGQAESVGVKLSIQAELPSSLPFNDIELCSLLSNGLENAIFAASQVKNENKRLTTIDISVKQYNLSISIKNHFDGKIRFSNGIPATNCPGHGFGTRNIVSIVNSHGGIASFTTKDDVFVLRATIPLE